MNYLLFLIATILWIPATVINIVVVLVKNIKKHGFLKVMGQYFRDTAVDIDRFGNRNFRTSLNLFFARGYQFGDVSETISSVLGKNQRDGTLTRAGTVLCFILDMIDKNHCKKSIK